MKTTYGAFAENLDAMMTRLKISNSILAREIGVDSSLISKWRRGIRSTNRSTPYAGKIADYVVNQHGLNVSEMAWLKKQILAAYPATQLLTMLDYERAIENWLHADEEKRFVPGSGQTFPSTEIVDSFSDSIRAQSTAETGANNFFAASGSGLICSQIAAKLEACKKDEAVYLFLSCETIQMAVDQAFSQLLISEVNGKKLVLHILLQYAGNASAISRLLSVYMPLLTTGRLKFQVIQGSPQLFISSMTLLLPEKFAITIQEINGGKAEPLASVCTEKKTLSELYAAYKRSAVPGKQLMTVYDDQYSQQIADIFFSEYGMPGNLDVIKEGLNPMYMSMDAYARVLGSLGYKGQEYDWRLDHFRMFKTAMDVVLSGGTVFREAISVSRLREIIRVGSCRFPAIYYSDTGISIVRKDLCGEILRGIADYLERIPNFSVMLVDDASLFKPNSCWHIKNNHHVMIHSWDQDNPALIYSDQLVMIDEFERHFLYIWGRDPLAGFDRSQAIERLREYADQMQA